ncbi:hypothetical protein [Sulfurivirga sp.]|uniref:hypothetical protein n=1 Tax=Sulfurivirga sp. TaxID=2614236 RepID=UPI0025F12824|nr:hypothetical protein [Sulfurivirga sp.]
MSEINAYLNAVIAGIQNHFGQRLTTVAPYRPDSLKTPAALVAIERMEQADRAAADGRLPLDVSVAVHCILSHRTPDLQLALDSFATEVAVLAQNSYWDVECVHAAPERIGIVPGELRPDIHGVDSRVVLWEQRILVGQGIYEFDTLIDEFHFEDVRSGEETVINV